MPVQKCGQAVRAAGVGWSPSLPVAPWEGEPGDLGGGREGTWGRAAVPPLVCGSSVSPAQNPPEAEDREPGGGGGGTWDRGAQDRE